MNTTSVKHQNRSHDHSDNLIKNWIKLGFNIQRRLEA